MEGGRERGRERDGHEHGQGLGCRLWGLGCTRTAAGAGRAFAFLLPADILGDDL
jgi:hypothetical protein